MKEGQWIPVSMECRSNQKIPSPMDTLLRFILSMDGTSWKPGRFKYYVLAVGISFDSISLSICFMFVPGAEITSFVEEIEIIERVISIVGGQRIECLLADREFSNSNFMKWLQVNHIRHCLRLKENLYVRKEIEDSQLQYGGYASRRGAFPKYAETEGRFR